jgi:hypothetical protein
MKEKKLKLEDFKVQSFVTTTAANTLGGQPIWSTPYTACNDTSGYAQCYPQTGTCYPTGADWEACTVLCYIGNTWNCE